MAKKVVNKKTSTSVNCRHFCNIGDAISILPALKKYYEATGRKVNFLQQLDVRGFYYENAAHPTLDESGNQVMCNKRMLDMLKPLLESQQYIDKADIYNGQEILIDATKMRGIIDVNMPNQAIQQWMFITNPDLATNITKPWIFINENKISLKGCALFLPDKPDVAFELGDLSDKIILNFTERYRNYSMDYFFLKQYQHKLIFSGTQREYAVFCNRWELRDVPYLSVNNFLQSAAILKKSKFLLCNQSFLWNLSTAMQTPRSLEICRVAPNCQAFMDDNSYGFLNQTGLQFYFHKLNGTLSEYIKSITPPHKYVGVDFRNLTI